MSDEFENEELDEEEIEDDVITLTDEDGKSTDFVIMDGLEHNGKNYLLVIEALHADDDEADADILVEVEDEDETVVYEFIEDEDEFEEVSKLFQQNSDEYDIEL